MTSDSSLWVKFLHDSNQTIDDDTLVRYSSILSDRFATIEEFLAIDENGLISLGITDPVDRISLIKQVRLFEEKEQIPLMRQSAISNGIVENWRSLNQSTPLNPKSKCHLSPALLSRISFNDHSQCDELPRIEKKCQFEDIIETPARPTTTTIDQNEKNSKLIQSSQKRTPPPSARGMRTLKTISDTISLQKKILVGTDRLKRLALTKSIFKRQTTLISKKVSNLTSKIINPFTKIKQSDRRITIDDIKITSNQITNKSAQDNEERRTMQPLSLNNDIRPVHADQAEGKHIAQPTQLLVNKRFKLGATTTFVTRSLANHTQLE